MHSRPNLHFVELRLRGCGTVVSSPLVEPLGSPSVGIHLRRPFASSTELEGSSFLPILQNDTVFQSSVSQFRLQLFAAVAVATLFSLHRRLCFHSLRCSTWDTIGSPQSFLPRKEVIQPHLPIRLPCYDFTPVIGLTFDGCALAVHSPASGAPNSHGVTGGVYKARERIHRGMLIRDY